MTDRMSERREYQKAWREAHKDEVREYQRAYREENRERLAEQKRQWYIDNADRLREKAKQRNAEGRSYVRTRQPRPPEKESSRTAVVKALRRGDLVRPDRCEECGSVGPPFRDGRARIQAHHDDYSKPLDVRWLCRDCHGRVHRRVAA